MGLVSFSFRIVFSFLIFILWINLNLGFNLEIRLPLIKRGNKSDYFGYSVAQHQSIDEVSRNVTSWLLVGAPLGKNLQPETNRSGALFKCPILYNNETDCTQVVTDGYRDFETGRLKEPIKDEIKENQWMGVTVRSQGPGKKVLVCAHRYISKGVNFQWGWGLCYTLSQRLDYDSAWDFCRGRPNDRAHEQWGYCQMGTSGALLDDDTAVIGSPGPFTWHGTAFVVNISDDYLHRDKSIYHVSVKDSPVPKYSYLGMSVTGAKFFNNEMTYVAGAPKADEVGNVVLFSKEKRKNKADNDMHVDFILKGEQFASSFGYEVATADVNGDGLPDLLVGAPFYFEGGAPLKNKGGAVYIYMNKNHTLSNETDMKFIGTEDSRYGFAITNLGDINKDGCDDIAIGAPYENFGAGVVYIHLGSPSGLSREPNQTITPSSSAQLNGIRTFGYSLSGGMDLDGNGYPDLLIGAYESDLVVLLRSRPIIQLKSVIHPEKIEKIDPSTTEKGCRGDRSSSFICFTFQACVTVEAVVVDKKRSKLKSGDSLTLNYTLDADHGRSIRRVWIGRGDNRLSSISADITLEKDPKTNNFVHCQDHTVYLEENAKDIQSSIKFKLVYELVQKEPVQPKIGDPLPSVDNYPILNQGEAVKLFEAEFLKDCGDDNRCVSHLLISAVLNLPRQDPNSTIWDLKLGSQEEVGLNISAFNDKEPAYLAQLFVKHPASLSYKGKRPEGNNIDCEPHPPTLLICNLGNPFKKGIAANIYLKFSHHDSLEDSQSLLEFEVWANSTSSEYEPLRPYILRVNVTKQAQLLISGSSKPETVLYGGQAKGESAITYMDEIGLRVLHTYQVYNEGPWKVQNLQVNVDWPFQVGNSKEQGKWLLYLDEAPTVYAKNGGVCNMKEEQVNPVKIRERPGLTDSNLIGPATISKPTLHNSSVESEMAYKRVRRDVEMVVRPWRVERDVNGIEHKIYKMDCSVGTAKCINFSCTIFNLEKNQEATILIKARLWNATMIEDYSGAEEVRILSKAKLVMGVQQSLLVHQDKEHSEFQVVTIARVDNLGKLPKEQVDWWIYVVAIVIGLLILFLLTLLLWKLGFFKRKSMEDPTLSGNLEKHKDY